MAVFDGLINWWGWGDAAAALVDYGSFAAATATSVTFADHIAAYGLTPHDGEYSMGAVTYSPSNEINGTAEAVVRAPWACAADGFGIEQIIPSADYVHPVLDPQVGHWGNNLGLVPIDSGEGLWFDPRDGWTLAIWVANYGGYYIKRASAVTRQYLVGDHLITPALNRGWYIVADFDTVALVPPGVTSDGLATIVPVAFTGDGKYRLVMNNSGAAFSLEMGAISGDFSLLAITYDTETLRTYNLSQSIDPIDERPTTTGEITFGGAAMAFGARYNLGADDNGFTAPWNGKWDEVLQWNRALSTDEISRDLPRACDAQLKIKSRFFARNSEGNNRFARAYRIRGASGQSVPRDPAGHSIEVFEKKGANLKRGLHQTMWFKWTAPSSGSFTFHTGDGHPADLYSSAPLEVTVSDQTEPDPVGHPGPSSGSPAVGGTYTSPPPGGSVFPPYPRQYGHGLSMAAANGDWWLEQNPDSRVPGAARTIIDWPTNTWMQVQYPYTLWGWRGPSYGSDQTYVVLGRNPAYVDSIPQEDPGYLGPDHTDHSGPAETFPHWFTDVFPPAGHVWDTGWIDPASLDSDYPHITSDGGLSFDTLESGLWQLEFGVQFPSSSPQGLTVDDVNNPISSVIGINYPHWTNKLFKVRLRETVTNTVIGYREYPGWEMQLNSGGMVAGGLSLGMSDKDYTFIPLGVGRVPNGRNFVYEVWQNTGTTLHTEMGGGVWVAKITDDTSGYPYPVLP